MNVIDFHKLFTLCTRTEPAPSCSAWNSRSKPRIRKVEQNRSFVFSETDHENASCKFDCWSKHANTYLNLLLERNWRNGPRKTRSGRAEQNSCVVLFRNRPRKRFSSDCRWKRELEARSNGLNMLDYAIPTLPTLIRRLRHNSEETTRKVSKTNAAVTFMFFFLMIFLLFSWTLQECNNEHNINVIIS